MIKRTMGLLMALGLALVAGLVAAAPASADTCTRLPSGQTVCGVVQNDRYSPRSLPVTCNLASAMNGGTGSTWQANHDSAFADYRETSPGYRANCTDSDGYHIPWGYYGLSNTMTGDVDQDNIKTRREYNVSPNHWHKITSDQRINVRLYKYPSGQGPSRCCGD